MQATIQESADAYTARFEKHLAAFVQGVAKISDDWMTSRFPTLPRPTFEVMRGGRYVRIVKVDNQRSVYCFVDQSNGDVLKSAGWKAPAKHARGNIFDDSNGLSKCGPYGPAYLR